MNKLLIVGYGDIARRTLPHLRQRYEVHALSRHPLDANASVVPIYADLDDPASLASAVGQWDALLHFAPPGETAEVDQRTRHLVDAFKAAKILPRKLLYISTSGVYGDCRGGCVDESSSLQPRTARARRRVDAEQQLRAWCDACVILRVPGIYAADRLPIERLRKGTPVLRAEDDVYTNHIHAEDLAMICSIALEQAAPGTIYNISDDSSIKMGDWFDLVADRCGLRRPPRITLEEASQQIPAQLLSFMNESRRLVNARMKKELGLKLLYPTVYEGVPDVRAI